MRPGTSKKQKKIWGLPVVTFMTGSTLQKEHKKQATVEDEEEENKEIKKKTPQKAKTTNN